MALSNISREVCQDLLEKLNVNQIVDSNDLVKVKTQHANMAKLSVLYKQLMFVKKEIEEVVEDIQGIVEVFGKEGGYDYIFDSRNIMYADKKFELTEEVIKKLNTEE